MSTKEIAVQDNKTLEITEDKILGYLDSFGFGSKLDDNEKKQFIEIATAFQLNPFKREIYCIPFFKNVQNEQGKWVKEKALSIITGYETYLKRADRLHVLDGWSVKTEGSISNSSLKAILTIYRKDWKNPFIHEVYLKEYNQNNKIWKAKPVTMIKKVAIAQGFRLAFPDDMGGLPYTSDELPDNMTTDITEDTEVTEEPTTPEEPKTNQPEPPKKTKPSEKPKREMLLLQLKDVLKTDDLFDESEIKGARLKVEKIKSNADISAILTEYQTELNKRKTAAKKNQGTKDFKDKVKEAFKGEEIENFKDDIPGEVKADDTLDIF